MFAVMRNTECMFSYVEVKKIYNTFSTVIIKALLISKYALLIGLSSNEMNTCLELKEHEQNAKEKLLGF